MDISVNILRCNDGSYYVGITRGDLEHRLAEHQSGTYGGYTAARRPVTLVGLTMPSPPSARSKAGAARRRRR